MSNPETLKFEEVKSEPSLFGYDPSDKLTLEKDRPRSDLDLDYALVGDLCECDSCCENDNHYLQELVTNETSSLIDVLVQMHDQESVEFLAKEGLLITEGQPVPTSNVDDMFQIDVDDFYGTGDSRQEMEVTVTGVPDGYAFADPAER